MKYKRFLKRFVVALGMAFFLFCAFTFIVNYRDVKAEEKLDTEIRLTEKKMTINNIKNGMTTLKTRKIVTSRNYGKLEEGIKKYYKDYYAEAYAIYYNYDELINTTIESLENIHKDSPEFTTSLEKLAEEKTKLEAEKKAYEEITSKDVYMTYLNKDIPQYYKDYYKEVISKFKGNTFSREIRKELSISEELIEEREKLIKILKDNKEWEIEEDKVQFKDSDIQKDYQEQIDTIIKIINRQK